MAAAAILGALGFVLLCLSIARGWSDPLDRRLLAALAPACAAAARPGRLQTMLRDVSALGGDALRVVLLVVALALLWPLGHVGPALWWLRVALGGRLALVAVKAVVRRDRPADAHAVLTHTSSFPSGHSFNGAVFLLAGAMLLARAAPAAAVPAWSLAILLSLALGIARLLLGVHWPSDIAAGWLGAVAWVCGIGALAPA